MARDAGALGRLISAAYLAEQRRLHGLGGYGIAGAKWAHDVALCATSCGAATILDYGCGDGALVRAMSERGFDVDGYDPAVAGRDAIPAPADLVVCTDVLEHVEPEHIKRVGRHLRGLAIKGAAIVVSLRPAGKTLSDGRNAHIFLQPAPWWHAFFVKRGFAVKAAHEVDQEWRAFLRPR